jgi:hypothetical protein
MGGQVHQGPVRAIPRLLSGSSRADAVNGSRSRPRTSGSTGLVPPSVPEGSTTSSTVSVAHARQSLNLIGYALMVNSLTNLRASTASALLASAA